MSWEICHHQLYTQSNQFDK
uniref:Uncharacterized protein n=1 Tax=Arundo donax TaxID=35708 RepID=A0A0A9B6E4_ARUDO